MLNGEKYECCFYNCMLITSNVLKEMVIITQSHDVY